MDNKKLTTLIGKLEEIRASGQTYIAGEHEAIKHSMLAGGVVEKLNTGGVEVTLGGVKISIFQPYPDINRFYYEY